MGKILNVPQGFLKRHPFPGPGLAVRVLGDVTAGNALEVLRQVCMSVQGVKSMTIFVVWELCSQFFKPISCQVDEIFIQSIKDAGLYDEIWQAFAVFLPVRSVGVQGDQRTHSHVVTLRAVTSQDGMTAEWYVFMLLSLICATNCYLLCFITLTSFTCLLGICASDFHFS